MDRFSRFLLAALLALTLAGGGDPGVDAAGVRQALRTVTQLVRADAPPPQASSTSAGVRG